jgi:hypothetical protein
VHSQNTRSVVDLGQLMKIPERQQIEVLDLRISLERQSKKHFASKIRQGFASKKAA